MTVSDILNRTPASILNGSVGANVKKLTKDITALSSGVLDDSKFSSRAELEKAGLDRQYDALQARLARGSVYDSTVTTAKSKLTVKKIALDDIRAIVTDFRGRASDTSANAPTRREVADKALTQIASVLNRKDSGKYIFGGKTGDVAPIQGDITKLTEKNFTNVDASVNLVNISDSRSVDANMITSHDLTPIIKLLNQYKHTEPGDPKVQSGLDIAMGEAIKSYELLGVNVGEALDEVEKAKTENVAAISDAKKVLESDFTVNLVDRSETMKNAIQSLLINFKIAQIPFNVLDRIMSSS
jgi:hypothetical protein